jgi:aminoglycoside 3-N-acetyltransferase
LTEIEAGKLLASILADLGIAEGDNIMLGIDMSRIPLPRYEAQLTREAFREREEKWCGFVYRHLMDAIGSKGTLLVPAYSYSCSRPGSRFSADETPSEIGPFTEYFRLQSGVARSIHPIFSIAGTGPAATAILGDTGKSAFGADSPFARFISHNVKFLCLGVEIRNCITYLHHLEQLYGTPHRYHKSFDAEVLADGKTVRGPWFAFMAYRGMDYVSDFSSLQRAVDTKKMLGEVIWEGGYNHVARSADVFDTGMTLLRENTSVFVNRDLLFAFADVPDINPECPLTTQLTISCHDQGDGRS